MSPCIVHLTAATKEETLWRQIHYQILLKTRSDLSKVKLIWCRHSQCLVFVLPSRFVSRVSTSFRNCRENSPWTIKLCWPRPYLFSRSWWKVRERHRLSVIGTRVCLSDLDSNDDVEKACHRVIVDMESTLGESLQDYFNNWNSDETLVIVLFCCLFRNKEKESVGRFCSRNNRRRKTRSLFLSSSNSAEAQDLGKNMHMTIFTFSQRSDFIVVRKAICFQMNQIFALIYDDSWSSLLVRTTVQSEEHEGILFRRIVKMNNQFCVGYFIFFSMLIEND